MTAEQLEASRAERLRQNGHGALTLEDARTWIEETGLCLFLPKRQATPSVAPSFVEAVAGQRDATPDPKHIAIAEELLVRLELDGVAVRLNLLGQVGEHPDYVVAAWVLPYVYALRGDRDWRRSPQLTGSRQVSQLAVQAYKLLEAADTTVSSLKQALGREVTEAAVLRAITELWQQLRIIPVIAAPGQAAKWQLLRHRFQKAIAEGASTSQVTAISVLASIFLQAVIAASMEEVEFFLAPLTARSKVREVLRGLVATRQVHTISFGHAPHFYVAGTLPEFPVAASIYTSSSMPASAYFLHNREDDLPEAEPMRPAASNGHVELSSESTTEARPVSKAIHKAPQESHSPRKPASTGKPAAARPHFSRPAAQSRDRKPTPLAGSSRPARHSASDSRPTSSRSASARPSSGSRPASGSRSTGNRSAGARSSGSARPTNGARWTAKPSKPASGQQRASSHTTSSNGVRSNGASSRPVTGAKSARPAASRPAVRPAKSAAPAWGQRNGHANGAKPASKAGATTRGSSAARKDARPAPRSAARPTARPNSRPASRSNAQPARSGSSSRTTAVATVAKTGAGKRFGFAARPKQGTKKRG